MLAVNTPKQISVPDVPKERIEKLSQRIRPIMRFASTTRKGSRLELNPSGNFYYLKPVDLFTIAFTWPGTPKPDVRAPRLQKLRTIKTYHTWAYYGFFKPTIAEVLAQIPEDILDEVIAFELEPPENPLEPWDIVNAGYHVAETTFYGKRPRTKTADDDDLGLRRQLSNPELEGAAIVKEVDGQLVLHDPIAAAVIGAVGKHNCRSTLELNADRVIHFKQRLSYHGLTAADAVIVLLNVDDPNGAALADILMPGYNWQEIRDRGEVPFARGLAMREGIEEALSLFDKEAAEKLHGMTEVAVVVVDHQVAEVFPA